jgi:predicted Zn finger-like uncharacterized protein
MRIECQKCAAAYAIDDRLVTAKGVRAQCPRCRNLQLVKREGTAAASAPAAAPAPPPEPLPPFPSAAPTLPAAPAFTPPADPFALEFEAPIPRPGQAQTAAPPPARNEIDDLLSATPPPPPREQPASDSGFGPPAATQAMDDFRPPPPPPPQAMDDDFGPPPPSELAPAAQTATLGCRQCGKPLTDSFDQALGLCDGCRARSAAAQAPAEAELPSAPPASRPSPQDTGAPAVPQAPYRPPELREAQAGRSVGQMAGIGVIVLAVLGGGVAVLVKKPWAKKAPSLAMQVYAGPIDEIIRRWRLLFVDLSGTSAEHLAAGDAKLAQDTTGGYADAEEEFQKALVLDPKSDLAVAGYLTALALGRGTRLDDASYEEALGLIGAAETRSVGAPRVLIAHAELLLTRPGAGTSGDARALAERAITAGTLDEKAQGHLVVGHSYLSTNTVWATEAFEKALALDPKLKRGYYYRAQAFASSGEYRKAIDNLEKRLALDPDQWEATDALARFYVDVGEIERAHKTYQRSVEASPQNARARIALAMLAFQHQGKTQEAIDSLRALAQERAKHDERDVVDVLIQLVAAQRQLGQTAAALKDVNDALALAPSDPGVHLQAFLLALDRKEPAEARPHLAFLTGKLEDPGLEEAMRGRLLYGEGRFEEASAILAHAQDLDPRRTRGARQARREGVRSRVAPRGGDRPGPGFSAAGHGSPVRLSGRHASPRGGPVRQPLVGPRRPKPRPVRGHRAVPLAGVRRGGQAAGEGGDDRRR